MLIKSKYKIARRLGTPIFEKTQTQKFTLSLAKRGERGGRRPRALTDFGRQLLEKQKVRYTYLLNERQLKRYVRDVLVKKKSIKQDDKLFQTLETRLDNVAYRLGLGPTRLAVRQIVNHGHLCVNGKRVNIPSYPVRMGDTISIRQGSLKRKLFETLGERLKDITPPHWLALDSQKQQGSIIGVPKLEEGTGLDLNTVLEYYKR